MSQVSGLNASSRSSLQAPSPSQYHVHKGDTLSGIAARHGVSLGALERANPGIAGQRFIFPGDKLVIPSGSQTPGQNTASHTINRGETLSSIAAKHSTTVQAIADANPGTIKNVNHIYPGDTIVIPGGAKGSGQAYGHSATSSSRPSANEAQSATKISGPALSGSTLRLSPTDVLNIKKTLQTEWIPYAGTAQAKGIVDTILNRHASGHWGNSISSVVNARQQFSDVNGPISRNEHGRSSVEQIPASMVSRKVSDLVDSYLQQRATGTPSSIGTHLNYANPNFSTPNNMGWINKLDGPILGKGNAIHHHGTTSDLQKYRPQPFAVLLSGQGPVQPQIPVRISQPDNIVTAGKIINPTGKNIRYDSGGSGDFHASRHRKNGPGLHNGLDILSTSGQNIKAPISGVLQICNPQKVHSGFKIISADGKTEVRVFYAKYNPALIGKTVNAGDNVAVAQDLQMKGKYPTNVKDHIHIEVFKNGRQVNPKPLIF